MKLKTLDIEYGNAICYSGYRENQSPVSRQYPDYAQVLEDLRILESNWQYLRLYDCSRHAELVLQVIANEGLDFKVMLGCDMRAEVSNPNCPWGADFAEERLRANRRENSAEVDRMISLASHYPDAVFAVSVGNEATVEWNDHMVPVERVIAYVQLMKAAIDQPVSVAENYAWWIRDGAALAAQVDFLGVHTYPEWEGKTIDEALAYTIENIEGVRAALHDRPIAILEAGWATVAVEFGDRANEASQARYYLEMQKWARSTNTTVFFFEAFDEPWKGDPDVPLGAEKHWGLFNVDRTPKQLIQERPDASVSQQH